MEFDSLSEEVIGLAIKVQRALGPGLLESAYRRCLAHELKLAGHRVEEEVPLGIQYKGLDLPLAYRLDILVDDSLIIEIKTVEALLPVHEAQVYTYLRFGEKSLGLVFNFWAWPSKAGGIKRVIRTP